MRKQNSTIGRGHEDADRKMRQRLPHSFLLTQGQWISVLLVFLCLVWALPFVWNKLESFEPDINYRVPYETSQDYWQYERHLRHQAQGNEIFFVGDSVVWGEYVTPDGTWSAFLNERSSGTYHFINSALNGLYPLALEGLIRHYGDKLKKRKIILHCNLLWMSSPEADLSQSKEQVFNHPTLVSQFEITIPSYRASFDLRLGRVIGQRWSFLGWVRHLQIQYWDQKDPYAWTLADDGKHPPTYPNTYRFPWSAVDCSLISEPKPDHERGLQSSRHQPWSDDGVGTQRFDWVDLNDSLQWKAFKRLCRLLQNHENDFIVVIGPFNQHIMTRDNREKFIGIENDVKEWLESASIPFVAPQVLKSLLYGDASHPLTEGYERLAESLWNDSKFQDWLSTRK